MEYKLINVAFEQYISLCNLATHLETKEEVRFALWNSQYMGACLLFHTNLLHFDTFLINPN